MKKIERAQRIINFFCLLLVLLLNTSKYYLYICFKLNRLNCKEGRNGPYRGTCFCCNKNGHRYMDCSTASDVEKQTVKDNFWQKLAEFRAAKNSLNANGVTTSSR